MQDLVQRIEYEFCVVLGSIFVQKIQLLRLRLTLSSVHWVIGCISRHLSIDCSIYPDFLGRRFGPLAVAMTPPCTDFQGPLSFYLTWKQTNQPADPIQSCPVTSPARDYRDQGTESSFAIHVSRNQLCFTAVGVLMFRCVSVSNRGILFLILREPQIWRRQWHSDQLQDICHACINLEGFFKMR